MTVSAIADLYGVSVSTIRKRRSADAWTKRSSVDNPASEATPNSAPDSMQRRTLLTRLLRAVDSNLKLMEKRMNSDDPGTAADRERDTRTISTLTRTIGKITELQADTDIAGDTAHSRSSRDVLTDHEADRLRLEIAERILRLREQRDAR